jgi:hypothetical protein
MEYDVQLQNGGILATKEWNSDFNDFIEQPVEDEDLSFYFHSSTCLKHGVKLRDIFTLISRNIDIFSIAIGCPFLDDLVEEALSTPKQNEDREGMCALILDWASIIDNDQNDKFLHCRTRFYGIGTTDYSVEFAPINELAMYPIILNEAFNVMDEETVVFNTTRKFSLLEVLRGIVDEVAYMGPPDIKQFALKEIQESVDKIKELSEEDLEKKFDEKIAETEKLCKICQKEARSPHFDKPLDICVVCFNKIREN